MLADLDGNEFEFSLKINILTNFLLILRFPRWHYRKKIFRMKTKQVEEFEIDRFQGNFRDLV